MKCTACILKSKGVNAKNPPAHTCLRADKKYVEPESKKIGDNTYFKVEYRERLFDNLVTESSLYCLCAQYLNGCRVKRGTEVWFNHRDIHDHDCSGQTQRPTKWLWLIDSKYYKLNFI